MFLRNKPRTASKIIRIFTEKNNFLSDSFEYCLLWRLHSAGFVFNDNVLVLLNVLSPREEGGT